jgi:DNA repair exonuclease SbcCD nuclease subunit
MKISICSDLHIEFGTYNMQNIDNADVLVLAGDVCVAKAFSTQSKPHILEFFKLCSNNFKHVIYILGNHEHYQGVFIETLSILKNELSQFTNIYILERESITLDDVTFLCQTLWTDFNDSDPISITLCQRHMNDYRVIKEQDVGPFGKSKAITPHRTLDEHKTSINFLKNRLLELKNNKVVIVGHHAPSHKSVKPRYERDFHLNGAYRSNLEHIMIDNPNIKLWIHGHTHEQFDYIINQTRVVCNPRGYLGYERGPQETDPYYPLTVEV